MLTHDALDDDATRKVDGSLVPTPAIARVGYWGGPAEGDTYGFGETIWVEVVFSAAVAVSGRPQVALDVGGSAGQATYHSGGGGTFLYFHYVVQSADRDTDGISIPADALDLAGGVVTAEGSSTTDAELAHAAVPADAGRKVDGRAGVGAPPAITDVRFPRGPADGVTYGLGEQITVDVEFDKQVAVRGRPQVELDVGGSPRQAALFRVNSPIVQFQYTVQSGDLDGDGISIPADALDLAGGAILLDLGGLSTPADLTHDAVPADPRHRVDGTLEAPPRITRVSFWSSPGNGDTYGRHEIVWVEVAESASRPAPWTSPAAPSGSWAPRPPPCWRTTRSPKTPTTGSTGPWWSRPRSRESDSGNSRPRQALTASASRSGRVSRSAGPWS